MKLEVGMYVRTKYGIRKVTNIGRDTGYNKPRVKVIALDDYISTNWKFDYIFYTDEKVIKDIKKASFNIIDLIEEDDFVNEQIITKIKEDEDGKYLVTMNNNVIRNQGIESILTKEQFEKTTYKVRDEE